MESAASGLMVAYSIISRIKGESLEFPDTTMLGSLSEYISTENKNFQPMNANFGILKPLDIKIKDKKEKYKILSDRAIKDIEKIRDNIFSNLRK